jgi:TetR/AcrR family transcriptional regulator, fatty acid metabolism regulator protein
MTPEIFITDPSWPYSKAKTAVLTAASAVIREDGPRAATLKNIATRAGITEPAIFRHFEGVDGLFEGLFSAYERVYDRSAKAFSAEGKGIAKLREASMVLVDNIAASNDFAYVLLFARHIFRGYPELKAKITENDAKDQASVLTCINEGIKAGDIRSDIDPVTTASSLIGGIYVTALLWIESGFAFDLRAVYADRWDDFERMVAAKPAPKSREGKSASRERALSYFPLRPAASGKSKSSAAKKAATKTTAARKAKDSPKTAKAAKADPKVSAKAAAKAAPKAVAKKTVPAKKSNSKSK